MYKNYLFDLYGTLIDINTDEEDESLWEKLSLFYSYQGACYSTEGITDLYKKLCSKEKEKVRKRFPSYTNIDINIEKVFKELYEEKGVSPSVEMVFLTCNLFRCLSTKYIRLYKGVEDLLKTLKEKDKKVYLLSNAQRSFTYGELKRFDLIKYFDDIFISSDHLCSKPDPEFYNALIKKHNLKKSETIMIGNDYLSDINGSRNVGISSLYIHQSISPDIKGKLNSDFSVMDGDVTKIKKLIVK